MQNCIFFNEMPPECAFLTLVVAPIVEEEAPQIEAALQEASPAISAMASEASAAFSEAIAPLANAVQEAGTPLLQEAGALPQAENAAAQAGSLATELEPSAQSATTSLADAATRARVTYDSSLAVGEGATDKLGNIRVSSLGSPIDRAQALYHEEVHAFFTPRGPLQGIRADISMWAYNNSHLLQYTEEAIAETRAQLMTGGSLQAGLMFPLNGGYDIQLWRLALEGGVAAGGTYWVGSQIAKEVAK